MRGTCRQVVASPPESRLANHRTSPSENGMPIRRRNRQQRLDAQCHGGPRALALVSGKSVAVAAMRTQRFKVGQLRVKDGDFSLSTIIVREGKGGKDRAVMLPQRLVTGLREQIGSARLALSARMATLGILDSPVAADRLPQRRNKSSAMTEHKNKNT